MIVLSMSDTQASPDKFGGKTEVPKVEGGLFFRIGLRIRLGSIYRQPRFHRRFSDRVAGGSLTDQKTRLNSVAALLGALGFLQGFFYGPLCGADSDLL